MRNAHALDMLREDHQVIETLYRDICTLFDKQAAAQDVQRHLDKLQQALDAHTRIEEEIFYPALSQFEDLRPLIKTSIEEHRQVDQLLMRLANQPVMDAAWRQALDTLHRVVTHHVAKEEHELLPEAQTRVSIHMLRQLAKEMRAVELRELQRMQQPMATTAPQSK
jgi:iron-sulfur cluster repair protein YtfE (RIC family)